MSDNRSVANAARAIRDSDLVTLAAAFDGCVDPNEPTSGRSLLEHAIDAEVDHVINGDFERLELTTTAYLLSRGADHFAKLGTLHSSLDAALNARHWLAVDLFSAFARWHGMEAIPTTVAERRWQSGREDDHHYLVHEWDPSTHSWVERPPLGVGHNDLEAAFSEENKQWSVADAARAIVDLDAVRLASALDGGVDANACTADGTSLLTLAVTTEVEQAISGRLDELESTRTVYLIYRGADPFAQTGPDGASALDTAKALNHWLAIDFFSAYAAWRHLEATPIAAADRRWRTGRTD